MDHTGVRHSPLYYVLLILPIANSYNCIAESVTSQAAPVTSQAAPVTSQAAPVTPQAETTVQQPATNAASKKGTPQKISQTKKTSKRPAKCKLYSGL